MFLTPTLNANGAKRLNMVSGENMSNHALNNSVAKGWVGVVVKQGSKNYPELIFPSITAQSTSLPRCARAICLYCLHSN